MFGISWGIALELAGGPAAVMYAAACVAFRVTGVFAARPAVFLVWARRAGLLRVSGVGYQFRHDTFRQWLVAGALAAPGSEAGQARDEPRR